MKIPALLECESDGITGHRALRPYVARRGNARTGWPFFRAEGALHTFAEGVGFARPQELPFPNEVPAEAPQSKGASA